MKKVREAVLLLAAVLIFTGCAPSAPAPGTEPVVKETAAPAPTTEPVAEETAATVPVQRKICQSFPLGTASFHDLNGDGAEEELFVDVSEDGGILRVDGMELETEGYWFDPTGYYTVTDVFGTGQTLLVGISDYGLSDDYWTQFYAYDDGQICAVGGFDDILGRNDWDMESAVCNGDGTFSASTRLDVLGTWFGSAQYRYDGDALRDITEFYRHRTGWEATTKCDVLLYARQSDSDPAVVVPRDTKVCMTGCIQEGEMTYWAALESDAFEGTLWAFVAVDEYPQLVETPDGAVPSEEAFDGFFFAG